MRRISILKFAKDALVFVSAGVVLAACGSSDNVSSNEQYLATTVACNAAWNTATVYLGGATVSYNSSNYTAAYWTQGNNPATSNGPAGSGQPWIGNGTCGTVTTTIPAITAQPQKSSVAPGVTASFSVAGTGGSLSYQWKKNGVVVAGATQSTYSFVTSINDQGSAVSVTITNTKGTVVSQTAYLTVGVGLSAADTATLTTALDKMAIAWDDASVGISNSIFWNPQYTAGDLEIFFTNYFSAAGGKRMTASLSNYIGYPLTWWGDKANQIKLQRSLPQVLSDRVVPTLAAVAPTALNNRLRDDTAFKEQVYESILLIGRSAVRGDMAKWEQARLADGLATLVSQAPTLMRANVTLNSTTQSDIAFLREQIWGSLEDAVIGLTDEKQRISSTLALSGNNKLAYDTYGILVHDNNGFDAAQWASLNTQWANIPRVMLPLASLSCRDFYGTATVYPNASRVRPGVNIFGSRVGSVTENPFPIEVSPELSDSFNGALAHEHTHIIDGYYVELNASLKARRDALIGRAGAVSKQYLRSVVTDSDNNFFINAPQEFVASMSNVWMTSTRKTFDLAKIRFQAGFTEPANQVLFMSELFSLGQLTTKGYATNAAGVFTTSNLVVARGIDGRINRVTFPDRTFIFTLDAQGNVTGIN